MLSIGKLGAGQHRYYTEKVAEGAEDYYSGEGEAEGYWLGDGAEDLGLQGKVDPDQLAALLTGNNPATGEPLGLRPVPGRGPVPGFDLTFSAPKSVSLTWALGGHPAATEVAAAHRASVEAAMNYMQRHACFTRRGAGGHEFVQGRGFIAAAYQHRSSRAGDPQLHTHVLIANATRGPDGRFTRLYHPAIYDHAKTAGYIYEAHLRDELTRRLGVRWGEVRNGIAEIDGFDPEHLRAFSTRRKEILEATGPDASARARQIATLETRKAKKRDISAESLREGWRTKAEEIGLSRESIRETLCHERQVSEGTVAIAEVEAALTAHVSHFDRRDVIQAVAEGLPAGAPAGEVEELADSFLSLDDVIRIAESAKGARFTTRAIWELEGRALGLAEQLAGSEDSTVANELIVARVIASRPSLKDDQRAMVERLLSRGEGLVVVIGEAGSGKTHATVAAAEGWVRAGVDLRVAAPTWRAANVLRSEGLEAMSIAGLLAEFDRKKSQGEAPLASDSVLLIDEAGMVDSATLARLIDHAAAAEAKLVLIGDPAQLGEIEAGGLFASIADRVDPVRLDEVIRHRHELDREGAKRIREGGGGEALSIYRSEGRVIVADDPELRREEMVRDWLRSYREGEDALMIAKRNAEVEKLNALARQVIKAEGKLGGPEIEVGGQGFAVGDQIITRINDHRAEIYNRERWRVAEVDIESGSLVLDGIDTARRVGVDPVYLGRLRQRDEGPAIEHAYAATTYQAQGATVDRAYVMADPSMDRQEFYVAASRSREETYLYVTLEIQLEREEYAPRSPYLREGLEHIAEAAERDGAQVSAHDEALRSRLAALSPEELARRRDEIFSEAGAERQNQETHRRLSEGLAETEQRLEWIDAEWRTVPDPRRFEGRDARWEREDQLRQLETREAMSREAAAQTRAELRQLPPVEHGVRAEVAVIDHLLSERERSAFAAARVRPPDYITKKLGERPSDLRKREAWDKAVRGVEGYRLRNGVVDRDSALGPKPESGRGRSAWESQQRQLRQSQQTLERVKVPVRTMGQRYRAMSANSTHRAGADQRSASLDVLSEPLLKVEDAAELLRVPRSTLYELVRSRHLPHIRVGRGLRFTRSDLAGWIQENTFR